MSTADVAAWTEAVRTMGVALNEAGRKAALAMQAIQSALPPERRDLPEDTLRHIDALIGEDDPDPVACNAAMETDAWEFVDAASWSGVTA